MGKHFLEDVGGIQMRRLEFPRTYHLRDETPKGLVEATGKSMRSLKLLQLQGWDMKRYDAPKPDDSDGGPLFNHDILSIFISCCVRRFLPQILSY